MEFDVTTLHARYADQRWNRMAVGDLLDRRVWPPANAFCSTTRTPSRLW